ncbi:Zn-clus domain containing protein [Pyrenophora tritici-repentis]|nr:Zn-clus domain containing protein [Pyrenophora tritici-repentis]KAI1570530.1 Zn-clus domain containing protein [Pyrenophora tritici-repentis]KAI1578855.1 Zn-clus domain containing protein [Pyrenophora tritici-repentis]KAI2486479.1 Zn-clus domain containing protein [Pyrenophora tritici-repentis]PWO25116.1 hypothetical protein PtrARCrB10_06338 [Pyrenophora tritici-repentis]
MSYIIDIRGRSSVVGTNQYVNNALQRMQNANMWNDAQDPEDWGNTETLSSIYNSD